MIKKILALLLAGILALTPALAATEDLFPAKNAYPGFADVAQGEWYSAAVQTCYEVGLMNGTGEGNFTPAGIMTVAEAATIAARIREALTGEPIVQPEQDAPWYEGYVNYLMEAGVSVALPTQRATRAQFFSYLSAVVPESELPAINAVTALPDSDDADVLRFYNAGILNGTDAYGTFRPAGSLSRAECAAMVARIIRPALRQRFTLQAKPAETETGPSYQEELDGTMAMMINGAAVSMNEFVNAMDRFIFETDYQLTVQTGKRLDWSMDYGVGDLPTFFREQTKAGLTRDTVLAQQAAAMGCTQDALAATLTPDPSQEILSAYAQGLDLLAAKHILLQTYDSNGGQVYSDEQARTLAQQIIDALNASPSMQQFENLMALYNDDPGMTAYPEGYLFSKGEMVEEFETAVRELAVGAYTAEPVKSVYGYHIILRLDPAGLTELKTRYQNAVLDALADTWVDSATVTVNDVMLNKLNVQACYEQYFALLQQQAAQQQG